MDMLAEPAPAEDEIDVLFIEDDPDLAELYELKLHLDGYRVHAVHAGTQTLDSEVGKPDIVYVDVKSYDGPGAVALKRLHTDRRLNGVPRVVLSHDNAETLRAHGVKLDDLDYLVPV
ncbi:MAG TPA: response regulator [Candidatus Limnocylindrales bacterium]|nr:response regulator [Candidatus Limnocylindrales bacterium]